jgi:hypothetical protein
VLAALAVNVNEVVDPPTEITVDAAVQVEDEMINPHVFNDEPNDAMVPPSTVDVPLMVILDAVIAPLTLNKIDVEGPEITELERIEICVELTVDCDRINDAVRPPKLTLEL